MKQAIKHGATIDALTPEEANRLLESVAVRDTPVRVRGSQVIALDASGNGQDEVYAVPAGFEFEARRVFCDLDTASDPNTGAVALGATPTLVDVDASATGAAAALAATLPGVAGATTYITGFEVTGAGATAGSVIVVTVTGILGGTKSYELVIPAGAGVGITPLIVQFARPIPASGPNQAIAVNVPSFGAGNTNAAVTAHGYQSSPVTGKAIEYLRSGLRLEYGVPQSMGTIQVPGVQSWAREQGPYLRNGEVFEVKARGLTPNARLSITVEGILRRPNARTR